MSTTLAEELRLLASDAGGKHPGVAGLHTAMGGALVLELALAGAVTARDERLVVAAGADDEPLLRRARAQLTAGAEPLKPAAAVMAVAQPADEAAVRDRLVERGLLAAERAKRFGVLTTTRHPLRDPEVRDALVARVAPVMRGEATTDGRTRWLAMLAAPFGDLVARVAGREHTAIAKAEARAFAETLEGSAALLFEVLLIFGGPGLPVVEDAWQRIGD